MERCSEVQAGWCVVSCKVPPARAGVLERGVNGLPGRERVPRGPLTYWQPPPAGAGVGRSCKAAVATRIRRTVSRDLSCRSGNGCHGRATGSLTSPDLLRGLLSGLHARYARATWLDGRLERLLLHGRGG